MMLTLLSMTIRAQFNPWSSTYTALATDFRADHINKAPQMRVETLSDLRQIRYGRVVDREAVGGDKLGMLTVSGLRKGDYITTTISTLCYTNIEIVSYQSLMRSDKRQRLGFALYYRWSDASTAYKLSEGYWVDNEQGNPEIRPFRIKLDALCDNRDAIELRWVLLDDPETDDATFLIATTIYGGSQGLSTDAIPSADLIYVKDHTLIVCSNSVQRLPVRNIEGQVVRWLTISEGENRFAGFAPGLYLVGSCKVLF